jgi:hypothetical protein
LQQNAKNRIRVDSTEVKVKEESLCSDDGRQILIDEIPTTAKLIPASLIIQQQQTLTLPDSQSKNQPSASF